MAYSQDIGFKYEKRSNKAMLLERDDIIVWRHKYLRNIKEARKQKKPEVFMDETWVNVGQTTSKLWRDTSIKTPKDAFLAGLTTGLKDPTQRGPRFVIVHAGGKEGFVQGAKLVFLARKGTADFHDEMNSDTYEKWFLQQLLPNITPGSVIVIDNASYHSRKSEKIPVQSSNKAEIKQWLTEKNIEYPEDALKRELLEEVNKIKHMFSSYAIDKLAEERGFTVLRLPPYHCELNPIEMVWSQVKRHVAVNNTQFKKSLMPNLIENAFASVTVQHWINYCKHVENVEEEMWRMDGLQDDVEPFIIQLTGSSSSESNSATDTDFQGSQGSVISGVGEMSDD